MRICQIRFLFFFGGGWGGGRASIFISLHLLQNEKTHTHRTVPSPPSVTMRSTFVCRVSTSFSVEADQIMKDETNTATIYDINCTKDETKRTQELIS